MTDHSSNFTDESRAKTARTRAAATARKAKSRARQAERQKVKALDGLEADEAQRQIWQTNRENLTADQRLDLESRQERFVDIAGSILTAIEDLKLGKVPGVSTYWPDVLFEEVRDYRKETQPDLNRILFHPGAEEFIQMYSLGKDSQVFKLFADVDPEWYLYGYFTRVTTAIWNEFLCSIVGYFQTQEANPEIDWTLADEAVAEREHLHPQPRRTSIPHINLIEAKQRAAEEKIAAGQIEKERQEVQRALINLPINFQF